MDIPTPPIVRRRRFSRSATFKDSGYPLGIHCIGIPFFLWTDQEKKNPDLKVSGDLLSLWHGCPLIKYGLPVYPEIFQHSRSCQLRFPSFCRWTARKVVLKTGLKLNPKKLYGADGYAVKDGCWDKSLSSWIGGERFRQAWSCWLHRNRLRNLNIYRHTYIYIHIYIYILFNIVWIFFHFTQKRSRLNIYKFLIYILFHTLT